MDTPCLIPQKCSQSPWAAGDSGRKEWDRCLQRQGSRGHWMTSGPGILGRGQLSHDQGLRGPQASDVSGEVMGGNGRKVRREGEWEGGRKGGWWGSQHLDLSPKPPPQPVPRHQPRPQPAPPSSGDPTCEPHPPSSPLKGSCSHPGLLPCSATQRALLPPPAQRFGVPATMERRMWLERVGPSMSLYNGRIHSRGPWDTLKFMEYSAGLRERHS